MNKTENKENNRNTTIVEISAAKYSDFNSTIESPPSGLVFCTDAPKS